MTTDYYRFINDPEARTALLAAAKRERSREVYRLVFEPLLNVLRRPKLRTSRMLRSQAYC